MRSGPKSWRGLASTGGWPSSTSAPTMFSPVRSPRATCRTIRPALRSNTYGASKLAGEETIRSILPPEKVTPVQDAMALRTPRQELRGHDPNPGRKPIQD